MSTRRLGALAAVVFALVPGGAHAATPGVFARDEAVQIASKVPAVQAELSRYRSVAGSVIRENDHWLVRFGVRGHTRAEVTVDILSGKIGRVLTGVKAEFPLARGQGSGFARRKLNAVWIWLPLTLLFVGAFFDWRRPLRLLHFDMAAIALLGVSFAFFMQGKLSASVPLVYPTLAYVVMRCLVAGARPASRAGPLTRLALKPLIVLVLALLAGRIILMLADPFVSDVGYAGVAGAKRILDGLEVYTRGGQHFDTYGPLAYFLYVPFVLVWPFHESQTNPPAAQAAAIAWELATVAGLVVLGRRLRPGTNLGWALALAWTACPFTALSLVCASNDTLVAALLVWAFVALASGPVSGALTGAAAAVKFSAGFLGPLLARGAGPLERRRFLLFTVAFMLVGALTLLPLLPPGGVREFYDATIGFQLHRFSPFSIWSQHTGLHGLQTALKVGSLALALVVAFVPRGPRTTAQVAALAAAVLVASQIPLQHWFYLYVPWFLPLYCVAVFSEQGRERADARSAA
jgi:hypothetical protein